MAQNMTQNSGNKPQEDTAKRHSVNDTRLYTVREWWDAESGKGIMLKLSARDDDGNYRNVKAYIPLESVYEDATIAKTIEKEGNEIAVINVRKKREFGVQEIPY